MFHVIIPARYASTRLPGKPLQDIAGKPMIQHVWEQARRSSAATVTVATDDRRILDACRAFGADAVLTREDHPSGTDRLQAVASLLGLRRALAAACRRWPVSSGWAIRSVW